MKKLFVFVLLCTGTVSYGQQTLVKTEAGSFSATRFSQQAVDNYFFEIREKQIQSLQIRNSIDTVLVNGSRILGFTTVRDTVPMPLFNEKFLNLFFASTVSQYVTTSKDLTLQKISAVIDAKDKSLFIGGNFDFRANDLDKLTHLLTVGVKAKLKDDFSTLFKNGDKQNDIGVTLKYTNIRNGSINYGGAIRGHSYKEIIETYRNTVLRTKYLSEADKFIKEEYNQEVSQLVSTLTADEMLDDKAEEIYKKMATSEMEFIKKNKVYHFFSDRWFTAEGYIPVTETSYDIITAIYADSVSAKKETYIPWKLSGGYTYFRHYSTGNAAYLSIFGNVKNNNTILTGDKKDKMKTATLQVTDPLNENLITDTKEYYTGRYKEFVTPSINSEVLLFFIAGGVSGISGGVERTFGPYSTTNWKLGIPFSLKDKEGKPTVNFEIAWKEVNKDHYVGINVGFTFGKTIQ